MNEKIKELKQQAIDYAWSLRNEGNLASLDDIFQAKFAELIVGECIALANKYAAGGAGSEFDVGYISCAETLAQEMKQHFQIEE